MMVSVITPVFNCEKYIGKTLDSILSQTYTDFEILLADDQSTDRSVEIIQQYMQTTDRIRFIQLETNAGAAAARNAALAQARGKYIAFVDSDDTWERTKLEEQVAFMEENRYDFTYTHYNRADGDGHYIDTHISPGKITYKTMLRSNPIGCSTVMLNQQSLGRVQMPALRKRQDYAMWLKVLRQTANGVCYPKALTNYTVRSDSLSANKGKLIQYNYRVFREAEGFGMIRSLYYLGWNVLTKLLKR